MKSFLIKKLEWLTEWLNEWLTEWEEAQWMSLSGGMKGSQWRDIMYLGSPVFLYFNSFSHFSYQLADQSIHYSLTLLPYQSCTSTGSESRLIAEAHTVNSTRLVSWAHRLIARCPPGLIVYPYAIISHLHLAPTYCLCTHDPHIPSPRLIVRSSYANSEIAWLIAHPLEVCSPDDLLFIVPSHYDRFTDRFCADLLIGTTGYSVLAAIPWTTQCSPRFPRQPGLIARHPRPLIVGSFAAYCPFFPSTYWSTTLATYC